MILSTIGVVHIGLVLSKAVLAEWIGPDWAETIVTEGFAGLWDRATQPFTKRSAATPLDTLVKTVAHKALPMFNHEAHGLDDDAKRRIVREVGQTLALVTPDVLLDSRLVAEQLRSLLLQARPSLAQQGYSEHEIGIHDRLVRAICDQLVAHAQDFPELLIRSLVHIIIGQQRLQADLTVAQRELLTQLALLVQKPLVEDVTFEHQYLKAVALELDRLDLFGLTSNQNYRDLGRQNLTHAYIPLRLEVQETVDAREAHGLTSRLQRLHRQSTPDDPEADLPRSTTSIQGTETVLAQHQRIVIRGMAGSGKSTLLQWLAVRLAQGDIAEHAPLLGDWATDIPVFVRLRALVGKPMPSLSECVTLLGSPSIEAHAMPAGWMQRQCDAGRVVFLIDGVDELPQSQRSDVLAWLQRLVRMYPHLRCIVTSRPEALKADPRVGSGTAWNEWEQWTQEAGCIDAALLPLGDSEIRDLVNHWYDSLARILAPHLSPAEQHELRGLGTPLLQLLRAQLPLRRLATSPLLCAMLCALYEVQRDALPTYRLQLYQDCLRLLLGDRDRYRKVSLTDYPPLPDVFKLKLLRALASEMLLSNQTDAPVQAVDALFQEELEGRTFEGQSVKAKQVRHYFIKRAGLLRMPTVDTVDFTHRTFQEYLGALDAERRDRVHALIEVAANDHWRETIILAAGIFRAKDRAILLQGLLEHANRQEVNQAKLIILAVACLEMEPVGDEVGEDVRKTVIVAALAVWPNGNTSCSKFAVTPYEAHAAHFVSR